MDCSELSPDEELALSGELTGAMRGRAIAFIKGRRIVFDNLSRTPLDESQVENAVNDFIARRKDPAGYSIERRGDTIVVHSPDPVAAARNRRMEGLPPNLFKCPFCSFVTPYQELYVVHSRSHGFL